MDLKDKKILIVSTTDNMIGNFMIPHIKQMQEMGAEVHCACNKRGFHFNQVKEETGAIMHDVYLTRFPFNPKLFKGYKQLKDLVKQNGYDLINCMQPVGGFMGRMLAKKFKLPCLYTAHGFHFYEGAPLQNRLIYKTIENYCSKFTTVLVTMNEEDYKASQSMKAQKTFKINGIGVDLNKYKQDESFNRAEFKKSLGLNEDDFVIVSVGELNKNKNTLRLVEAIKDIKDEKVKYLICGEGPLKQEYEEQINEFNLSGRVKLLGFRKDVPQILNSADVFVMPSYREGLSKAMMEAMAYGLPVVASKIRGNTDLIGENEGGILLDPEDTIGFKDAFITLYNNKELCQKYSTRNKEYIKNFSIETVLEQMKNIYKEI